MTERDLIREVVEKSITRTVDIEVLRKWAKEKYAEACLAYDPDLGNERRKIYFEGKIDAFREMIQKLDELEGNNGTSGSD